MNVLNDIFHNGLQWQTPIVLWALTLPIIAWGITRYIRIKHQTIVDQHLWPWVQGVPAPTKATGILGKFQVFLPPYPAKWLLGLAWSCLILALAGPGTVIKSPDTQLRQTMDVLVSIDLSHSMSATDLYPNRFLFAQSLVESLKNQLEPKDRIALQAFAGQPHIVSPLSQDHKLFQHMLNLMTPNLLPLQGSWVERALLEGMRYLTQTGQGHLTMVILTDGAPQFWRPQILPKPLQSLALTASSSPSKKHIKLVILGIGTLRPHPLFDPDNPQKIWHVNGQPVHSKLEEASLQALAKQYGGTYLRAEPTARFMNQLLDTLTQNIQPSPISQTLSTWKDYSPPFMLAALCFLVLAFYPIGPLRTTTLFPPSKSLTFILPGLLSIYLCSTPYSAYAQNPLPPSPSLQQAYQAYQAQQYSQALSQYRLIRNYHGALGAGSSAYQLNDWESAVYYFRQAAWLAQTDLERASALFNLGNSYYQVQLFQPAIQAYQQALLYHPKHSKARHNLALAHTQYQQHATLRQAPRPGQKGKGEGENSSSQSHEHAFYGGQTPSQTKEPGLGSEGDHVSNSSSSQHQHSATLSQESPISHEPLPYPNPNTLSLNTVPPNLPSAAQALLEHQYNQQRANRFKQRIQQLEDQQKTLLKRLFERESGFHAPQPQPHPIPGMQPW